MSDSTPTQLRPNSDQTPTSVGGKVVSVRSSDDTIAAVSTPAGVGGIAVVRVSGPDALAIVTKHLTLNAKRVTLQPRKATYCRFDELDDLVAVYFPVGYSGEPTVELSCHGSLYVQQALLQVIIDDGARLAAPGEFTLRAFRHGRLNLSQAEAVADLIDAVTPAQHRLAVSQLRGGYAEQLRQLRQRLLDLTSLMELELDFSQEDVEFADRTELRQLLSTLHTQLSTLIASFRMGNALKRGLPVAIVGRPNAGKSSLLNALVDDDRAIVSDLPGTTRDTVEETLTLGGIGFRFIDTAGLRHATDSIESMGIERSLRAVEEAQLVLYVHDATTLWQEPEVELEGKKVICVLNKCDLGVEEWSVAGSQWPVVKVSAKRGDGIDDLKAAMIDAVRGELPADGDVLLSNARHYHALQRVQEALAHVDEGLADGTPADLLAVDLRDALYHLGTVTGEVANDEILGNIFSRFCVGK